MPEIPFDTLNNKETLEDIDLAALDYHQYPKPGKFAIVPTKQLSNPHDLSLAYSPGVAAPCKEIQHNEDLSYRYTNRGNLVGVVTNGTAVLGLGNIGALAGKPVMEGKAVLFKKFANIDVFDIEINEQYDLDKLVDIIVSLEPTFGGINLEDIKAPDCFYVERKCRERMNIPVFHDDQHGTAIVVGAAVTNGLHIAKKNIQEVKLVASGAGAAALACLNILVKLGLPRENIWLTDLAGVVHEGRVELMDDNKVLFAQKTSARTLSEVIDGADIFLGLSAANVLKPDMVKRMNASPLIYALANPTPEIMPEVVRSIRSDAIIATGRSDYPNQVNNVLCFPYIFRGALDAGARTITPQMEIAAVNAIAELARAEQNEVVASAYLGESLSFGRDYLIPKPFDPRLMMKIAPAVAQAAADSGVAKRPIADMDAYRSQLEGLVYASGNTMRPIFNIAKHAEKKKIAFAEGEEERILRAVRIIVDEGLACPTLIGRPAVIAQRIEKFGLRLQKDKDYEVVNIEQDVRYRELWQTYHAMMARKGITQQMAKIEMRRRLTPIGSMLLRRGDVDGLICGTWGRPRIHINYIDDILGDPRGDDDPPNVYACMNGIMMPGRQVFLVDTHLNYDPTAKELAHITIMAAESIRRFGFKPKVALLSHSNFGDSNEASALKMRQVLALLRRQVPNLEVDGEMHGDIALDGASREKIMPFTTLHGNANLLVCPNLDAANISYNLLKTAAGGGIAIGPILLGCDRPVHILTASSTVRRIVNMTALAVADANVMAGHTDSMA